MELMRTIDATRDKPLQQAVWLAATLGAFRPADLLSKVTDDPSQRRSLAPKLAALCAEVAVGDSVLWNLGADARRRAFLQMNEAGALRSKELPDFIRALQPRSDDVFGKYLREALSGEPDATAHPHDFDDHYAAYEFVGGSQAGADPSRARETAGLLDQQMQRANADEALVQTIGPNFVGRVRELDGLRQFARTPEALVTDPEFLKHAQPVSGKTPMMFINGVGGAGKSALIAKLAREMREDSSGVRATIIIDFDRPSLAGLNPIELSNEFLRQLAMCVPQIARDLSELGRTALAEFSYSEIASNNAISNYRMFERAMYSINARLRDLMARTGEDRRPMLIILDTFEEVLTLGASFVWRIYRWLQDLRNEAGLQGIRVILSGRATPEDVVPDAATLDFDPNELQPNLVGAVQLGDLEKSEALALLADGGIDAELGAALFATFGGNPLVLRLMNDYAKQEGVDAVRELMRDEDSRNRYQTQAAQRILYSRILRRIREDSALRALASPGLIVRVVTPGVIQNVMAVPCGLGTITNERAIDLFQKLARQVWLVKRSGEMSVTHRRDMRAIMLPLAREPGAGRSRDDLTDIAAEIHRRAFDYHRGDQPDPALTPEIRRDEVLYHQLFVEPKVALENPELRMVLPSLAGDLGDFPLATRAQLKRMEGKSLLPEEIRALDEEEGKKYVAQQAAQEISRTGGTTPSEEELAEIARPFREGLGRPIRVPEPAKFKKKPLAANDSNRILLAYSRAEFEEIAAVAPAVIMDFIDSALGKSGANLERDMTEHVSWIAAMSTLAIPRKSSGDPFVALAGELTDVLMHRRPTIEAQMLPDHSNFTLRHYVATLGVMLTLGKRLGEPAPDPAAYVGRPRTPVSITSAAALRIFQAAVVSDASLALRMQVSFVNADCLQYFAHLVDPRAIGQRASIITAQAAWSRHNLTLDVVHEAVDKLAPIAHHTLRSSALSGIERSLVNTKLDMYDWMHPRLPRARKESSRQKTLPWAALRGMSPDLQAPILAAVRERLQESSGRRELLDRLSNCSGVWPVDFSSKEIGDRKLGDTSLASIAHLADRFALLPMLFDGAKPDSISARVARVHTALQRLIGSATLAQGQRVALEKRVAAQAKAKAKAKSKAKSKAKKKVKAKVSAKKPAKKK